MKLRDYREDDLPHLKRIHSESGYAFAFPDLSSPHVGHVQVLVDQEDVPIMAACVKMVPEIILLSAPHGTLHPLLKWKGILMLHDALCAFMAKFEHDEAFSFLPPEIEKNYGRHLSRKCGWQRTWAAFRIGRG